MLIVVHALKPNSLTHSLQIYCTGLTGPRSHTSWAWVAKRDPTIFVNESFYKNFNTTFIKNKYNCKKILILNKTFLKIFSKLMFLRNLLTSPFVYIKLVYNQLLRYKKCL